MIIPKFPNFLIVIFKNTPLFYCRYISAPGQKKSSSKWYLTLEQGISSWLINNQVANGI
jgi:hypothetical protein